MLHALQPLLFLAHRLVESAGRLLSTTTQAIVNTIDEPTVWASPWDGVFERLHWAPVSAAVLAVASFAGFLLLVRYLQSADGRSRDSYLPRLSLKPDLSAFDIFVSVATALGGLTICWVIG
jgi:hypothetical protein